MKTQKTYSLPTKQKDFTRAISDPWTHKKRHKHAIDFAMPIGKPVLAAQSGEIVDVYMESKEGGTDDKYRENINKYTNHITIKHAENEFSQYVHLQHKSAKVNKGDKVKKGQVIANSGNTGFSTEPHLHFHVLRTMKDDDWETLKIKWETLPKVQEKIIGDRLVKFFTFQD